MADTTLEFDDWLRIANAAGLGFANAVNLHRLYVEASTAISANSSVYSVTAFGAVGDGVTDNRVAIQTTIDTASVAGGGTVYVPNGTYMLSQGAGFFCLSVPSNVAIVGQSRTGVVLKQVGGIAESVRLFVPTGADIAISNMTLDGNKANNSTQEHRHGVFADGTTRLRLDRLTIKDFTGDGIYFYTNANDSIVLDCYCTGNERNGLTLGGGGQVGCTIIGGQYSNNYIQQIDSEPGGTTSKIVILGARLAPGITDDFVLTVSGFSAGVRAENWQIIGCQLDGPVNCVWADSIAFIGCAGVSASTTLPHFRVYRGCSKITSTGCHWNSVNTGSDAAVVHVTGVGSGDAPEFVSFLGGSIKAANASMFGIVANGFTSLTLDGTHIEGSAAGASAFVGVYARSTTTANHIKSVSINNCIFKNFGLAGVFFDGTTGAEFIYDARVTNCTFDSTVAAAMANAIMWNSVSTPYNAVRKATSTGNRIVGNVTTMYGAYPDVPILIGGSDGPGAIYSCNGTPESAITANIGSAAFRRDGGANTTLYVKESGSGNTGWVAK